MIWKKITIETTTEAVDMISYTLGELGVEGIEIEDKVPLSEEDKKAMFIDILPELPPDDGVALISCYIDDPERDVDELVKQIEDELKDIAEYMNIGSGKITLGVTEDKDWINNWKEYFKPFWLEDILIKPTWIAEEDIERKPGDIMIEIDPGTAFGTGGHETTKLCIGQLRKYLTGQEEVLDLGCGSGILSIIASKLGAKRVFGVDIDELAVEASYENCKVNHIDETQAAFMKYDVLRDETYLHNLEDNKVVEEKISGKTEGQGVTDRTAENTIDKKGVEQRNLAKNTLENNAETEGGGIIGQYDIVVANILADVIIPLSARVAPYMKENGIFISSGIINTKEQEVRDALIQNGFEIIEVARMKDWVAFTAKRRAF